MKKKNKNCIRIRVEIATVVLYNHESDLRAAATVAVKLSRLIMLCV